MKKLFKLSVSAIMLLFVTTLFSQVPDPSNSNNNPWDYCPSVSGIQDQNFVCPGEITYPPNNQNSGSGNQVGNGVPNPSGTSSNGGSGFTNGSDIIGDGGRPKWLIEILELLGGN